MDKAGVADVLLVSKHSSIKEVVDTNRELFEFKESLLARECDNKCSVQFPSRNEGVTENCFSMKGKIISEEFT